MHFELRLIVRCLFQRGENTVFLASESAFVITLVEDSCNCSRKGQQLCSLYHTPKHPKLKEMLHKSQIPFLSHLAHHNNTSINPQTPTSPPHSPTPLPPSLPPLLHLFSTPLPTPFLNNSLLTEKEKRGTQTVVKRRTAHWRVKYHNLFCSFSLIMEYSKLWALSFRTSHL